jgi:hypothetical protein
MLVKGSTAKTTVCPGSGAPLSPAKPQSGACRSNAKGTHRLSDVLEPLFTEIIEAQTSLPFT